MQIVSNTGEIPGGELVELSVLESFDKDRIKKLTKLLFTDCCHRNCVGSRQSVQDLNQRLNQRIKICSNLRNVMIK